ncbi:MAG: TetR/AcrR family transcriptional regulator [Streptosporangiales bacterium]
MARISAEERRELLLDAAVRVMTTHGVAAGTTRAIVAEAGMRVSVFHYCFRSRDELLSELIKRLSATEKQAVWESIEPGGTLRETLAGAADGYLAHLQHKPGDEMVLFELNHHALRTPALRELAAEQYAAYYRTARELLDRVAEVAGIAWTVDAQVLTRTVITVLDGVTTTWLADRDTAASREVLHRLLDFVAGLAVPATGGPQRTERIR